MGAIHFACEDLKLAAAAFSAAKKNLDYGRSMQAAGEALRPGALEWAQREYSKTEQVLNAAMQAMKQALRS
jgi:hypothetical protein